MYETCIFCKVCSDEHLAHRGFRVAFVDVCSLLCYKHCRKNISFILQKTENTRKYDENSLLLVKYISRPENSLLAEDLDYESGVRQAPVITEDVARKLEDIIKQRVKDAAWDDVTRKVIYIKTYILNIESLQ